MNIATDKVPIIFTASIVMASLSACDATGPGDQADAATSVQVGLPASYEGAEALTHTISVLRALVDKDPEYMVGTTAGTVTAAEFLRVIESLQHQNDSVSSLYDPNRTLGYSFSPYVMGFSSIFSNLSPPAFRTVTFYAMTICMSNCAPTFSIWSDGLMSMSLSAPGGGGWSDTDYFTSSSAAAAGEYPVYIGGDAQSAYLSTQHGVQNIGAPYGFGTSSSSHSNGSI